MSDFISDEFLDEWPSWAQDLRTAMINSVAVSFPAQILPLEDGTVLKLHKDMKYRYYPDADRVEAGVAVYGQFAGVSVTKGEVEHAGAIGAGQIAARLRVSVRNAWCEHKKVSTF